LHRGVGYETVGCSAKYYNGPIKERVTTDRAGFGIDGIVGIEYAFANAPFTVGLDAKPSVELYNGGVFWFDTALTFRYTF